MSVTSSKSLGRKLPWVLGLWVRIPRLRLPTAAFTSFTLPISLRAVALSIVYIFLFFAMTGVVYLISPQMGKGPILPFAADRNGNPVWIDASAGVQSAFIYESIIAASIIFIGGLGFIFLFESTRYALNPSYGRRLLVLGLTLSLVAFVLLQWVINYKTAIPD